MTMQTQFFNKLCHTSIFKINYTIAQLHVATSRCISKHSICLLCIEKIIQFKVTLTFDAPLRMTLCKKIYNSYNMNINFENCELS